LRLQLNIHLSINHLSIYHPQQLTKIMRTARDWKSVDTEAPRQVITDSLLGHMPPSGSTVDDLFNMQEGR
jgi:hypothetical protein